ncbi:hypothetical protein Ddye_024341 [Dipteronia dyeriana]|uniref:Uncharacterized protein n=1 Tax=Dipteronia dyeriana TaxID=168575 RepID=A0AAD9TVP6_9ROSI|nr:hypothetical protein Ddye_024341 [Dipteronia dyeriana]
MFFVVVVFQSLLLVSLGLFGGQFFVAAQQLPQSEVDALNEIVKTMGAATNWRFDGSACGFKVTPVSDPESEPTSDIACNTVNNTPHITSIKFQRWSLAGVLPPQVFQLPQLQQIDLAYNYLNGSIPVEWSPMKLKSISVFGNRLSGNIPSHLGNIISLTYFIHFSI